MFGAVAITTLGMRRLPKRTHNGDKAKSHDIVIALHDLQRSQGSASPALRVQRTDFQKSCVDWCCTAQRRGEHDPEIFERRAHGMSTTTTGTAYGPLPCLSSRLLQTGITPFLCSVCSCLDQCKDPYADSPFLLLDQAHQRGSSKAHDQRLPLRPQQADHCSRRSLRRLGSQCWSCSSDNGQLMHQVTVQRGELPATLCFAQRAGGTTRCLQHSHVWAYQVLHEDHADWQTAAFTSASAQGGGGGGGGWIIAGLLTERAKDMLSAPCHRKLSCLVCRLKVLMCAARPGRDQQGDEEGGAAVRAARAYGGREGTEGQRGAQAIPSRTEQDRKMAESLPRWQIPSMWYLSHGCSQCRVHVHCRLLHRSQVQPRRAWLWQCQLLAHAEANRS